MSAQYPLCADGIQWQPGELHAWQSGVCCPHSCGKCGGGSDNGYVPSRDCGRRPGGWRACCVLPIWISGKMCITPTDTACRLNTSSNVDPERLRTFVAEVQPLRPAPPRTFAAGRRRFAPSEAHVRKRRTRLDTSSRLVWGAYVKACADVAAFERTCVGCDTVSSVVLVDQPGGEHLCPRHAHVLHATPLLPSAAFNLTRMNSTEFVGRHVDDFNYRFFKVFGRACRLMSVCAAWEK